MVLHEDARAAGRPARRALPLRAPASLARGAGAALQRLATTRTPLQGASDHGVSEALYLPDPDMNGIELYQDRPRDQWPAAGPGARVGIYTEPLDLEDLLRAAPAPSRRATPTPA